MKIIKPSATIIAATPDLEQVIEECGRKCYKSEDRITSDSAAKFIEHLKGLHHESVLEHGAITVLFICDRGVSHELVRHRIASFSQESTRYCNYSKDKYSNEITVIEPSFFKPDDLDDIPTANKKLTCLNSWRTSCTVAEKIYLELLTMGAKPQEARSVLPNSLKTEVAVTANPREWRHIFKMRTSNAAHPQIREIMIPLLKEFQDRWPSLYNDIGEIR